MKDALKKTLYRLSTLLKKGGEEADANRIRSILKGGEKELWEFLVSNDLWGGAGSIAD